MILHVVSVEQGNNNGQSIMKGSNCVLKTTDLIGCIAVLITGNKMCYMIHSDTNGSTGKGNTTLIEGIRSLKLDEQEPYEIGLIGGSSLQSLKLKYHEIKKILPNATFKKSHEGADSAYLDSLGHMAHTKRELAEQLHDNIVLSDDNDFSMRL